MEDRLQDVLIALVAGGGAGLAGLAVGAFVVSRRRRLLAAIGGGLVVGALGASIANANELLFPVHDDLAALIVTAMLILNVVAWSLGVLLGSLWGLRRRGSVVGALKDSRGER